MTTRPTTLVESDQLAQAAATILRNDDFIPKGKRWPFARFSKAHREYERAVQEITQRRRATREHGVERKIKKSRTDADSAFERAKNEAQTAHGQSIASAKQPYDEVEVQARSARDAAIAAANLAYQQAVDAANSTYQLAATVIDQKRDAVVADAKAIHDSAYAVAEAERKTDLAQIAKDMKTIALEGPMRIVEDREAWSVDDRKKALIGIVDMAGLEEVDSEDADLCLRNVAGYVFQDRFLKPEVQQHRLMDASLLEALVALAQRNAQRRPSVITCIHEIVTQSPGHSSPAFIRNLTQLYVDASADTQTSYTKDPIANEAIFETMRTQIADTLKLTPRRSQVPSSAAISGSARNPNPNLEEAAPISLQPPAAEITADMELGDLMLLDLDDTPTLDSDNAQPSAGQPPIPPKPRATRPPPLQRRNKIRSPEDST